MRNIILMCTKLKTTFTGNILQLFSSSDKALGHSVMLCPPCDDDDNSVQVTDRADWSQVRRGIEWSFPDSCTCNKIPQSDG